MITEEQKSNLVSNFTQSSFAGGINLFSEDHSLAVDEYRVGFNIRNLKGSLNCIRAPLKIESPSGLKQGLYGFDKYLVLFSAGAAYYTILDDNGNISGWTRIENFYMNPFVDYIYTQPVPASISNLVRKLAATNQINGSSVNTNVNLQNIVINGNPAGLVCQDGISQPFLIKSDGTAIRLQNYFQWTSDSREYVPIGLNMAYLNGILFVVAPNRKSIYRSASGRSLDFVVNVDVNGLKGGNADTVSYAVSNDDITCLIPLNSGQLFIGTTLNCFPVELNYDTTIFAEPTFINKSGISVGIVNQFSIVDVLGDYSWIDTDGLRSFNAVRQLTDEGRDSIFSQYINSLFTNSTQGKTQAAIVYRNHAYFSVKTIYGNVVLVFNMLTQKWVSVDLFETPAIKQFAVGKQSANPQLFFITDREVYKYFGSNEYLPGTVQARTSITENAQTELKLRALRAVFSDSTDDSVVTATEVSNGVHRVNVKQKMSPGQIFGIRYPAKYPVRYTSGKSTIDNLHFNFSNISSIGWKVGAEIMWRNGASLLQLQQDVETDTKLTTIRQQSAAYE